MVQTIYCMSCGGNLIPEGTHSPHISEKKCSKCSVVYEIDENSQMDPKIRLKMHVDVEIPNERPQQN